MRKIFLLCTALLATLCVPAFAFDNSTNSASINLVQITLSLILILGLVIGLSVFIKKFGLNKMQSGLPIKVIGGVSIGSNQRIMVIEAGEQWIVLGVTPQHISTITTMPRQETNETNGSPPNFSTWMQTALEKYHAKKP